MTQGTALSPKLQWTC